MTSNEVYDKDIESIQIDEDDSSVEGKSNSDSSPRSDRIFPKKKVPQIKLEHMNLDDSDGESNSNSRDKSQIRLRNGRRIYKSQARIEGRGSSARQSKKIENS